MKGFSPPPRPTPLYHAQGQLYFTLTFESVHFLRSQGVIRLSLSRDVTWRRLVFV